MKMHNNRKGFTLLEVLIVSGMIAFIIGAAVVALQSVFTTWLGQEKRTAAYAAADRAVNRMAGELGEAAAISDYNHRHEVRFALKRRDSSGNPLVNPNNGNTYLDYYIYYLYNASDGYPPAFTQSSYEVRRSALTGVVNDDLTTGTFAYSGGQFISDGVLKPPASDLAVNGKTVTLDISVQKEGKTARARTEVKARNL